MHLKKVFVELKRRKQVEELAVFVELVILVTNIYMNFLILNNHQKVLFLDSV
jgi:hypothetical protein